MDKRLEEQIERMRRLSSQIAQIHERLVENTQLLLREPAPALGMPLRGLGPRSSTLQSRPAVRTEAASRTRKRRRP